MQGGFLDCDLTSNKNNSDGNSAYLAQYPNLKKFKSVVPHKCRSQRPFPSSAQYSANMAANDFER
jgi:hypothetical protein